MIDNKCEKGQISVIIASYKNIDGIYTTINSILSQTYPDIEIVVTDDATPAFEKEPIEKYINEHNRGNVTSAIVIAHEKNVGTVKNFNGAIEQCHGEFIKVIAAEDCLAENDALERYHNFMISSDFDICFAKQKGELPDGTYKYELQSCESDYDLLRSYSVEQTRNRLFARNFLPAPASFFRRSLFVKYGLFSEEIRLIEDYPYWCYLCSCGVPFGYLDDVLVVYKLSGVTSSGVYSEAFMKDLITIYDTFVFPYDKRFGMGQKIYNSLKRAGLNYYMTRAVWSRLSKKERVKAKVKYAIFDCYTGLLEIKNQQANKKMNSQLKGKK